MKIKTIRRIIGKKFDEFLNSITDNDVKKLMTDNSLISGGCIASMLKQEVVNDYDVYFLNKETCLAVAIYYANQMGEDDLKATVVDTDKYPDMEITEVEYYKQRGFSQAGRIGIFCKSQRFTETSQSEEDVIDRIEEEKAKEDDEPKYRVKYVSPNAISLSGKIQIILRFYGLPEEIHTNYDFIHCTNYWTSKDGKLTLNQRGLESIITKELDYVGSRYPIASMIRIKKFVARGWTCNAGTHLKIAFQISKLNLEDIPTLEDQLVGVDVAYFVVFIDALKKAQKAHDDREKPFVITYNYICEIIDTIFND